MKFYIFLFPLIVAFSCSTRKDYSDVEYVKIYSIYNTDSVNDYNKGLGIYWFLKYNFKNDSVISRYAQDRDIDVFKTYAGRFNNNAYIDTLYEAVKFLRKFPEGEIQLGDSTATYCGPILNMEFKDDKGVHYYTFGTLDTPLINVHSFFSNVNELNWEKRLVNNNIVDSDKEAVNTAINLGYYNKREVPYVPITCDDGIDMNKIYGEWRSTGNKENRETVNTYTKETFTKNGKYYYEKIKSDTSIYLFSAKFTVDYQNKMIVLDNNISLKKLRVVKLTDECFEFEDLLLKNKFTGTFKYNRLKDSQLKITNN